MKHLIALTILFCSLSTPDKTQDGYEKYWQQRTKYTIKAKINTETDILSGHEKLIYFNQSPHSIKKLYFHLYQNAFQPGSYLDKRQTAYGNPFYFGKYESKGKGIEVRDVKIEGSEATYIIDNTIMEIPLEEPLKPGDSIQIEMNFNTYFDITASWRRMRVYKAYGVKNYNGGHWYPRISVFDRKFGWTADQHLVHEFYGDFGYYDVHIEMPKQYIIDATGLLQNRQKVLPEKLREKLDISNFKNKPLYSQPSQIIKPGSETKTWHFMADNVHDFAFVASPLFRIGEVQWNGITCRSLAMEPHAAKWQDAAQLTADIIKIFSEDFGKYAYPKMIVADVRSGMEYPMLTMNNGLSPDYAYIFAHEIGHNWFFGAVGTNETYRASLDEGFTQFLTSWALEKLSKKRNIASGNKNRFPYNKYKTKNLRYKTVYKRYFEDAFYHKGTRLNQHSDKFNTANPYGRVYRQTYYKGAVMLYQLKYVLGDSLFQSCMKHYYETWKFRHPYLEDMRNLFINHSGVNLNWFFDQWLNSRKTIDYSLKSVKKLNKKETKIKLERKGRMEMPLNVLVILEKGDSTFYHIPNRRFIKKTNYQVLSKWYGWDKLNREYTFLINSDSDVSNVIIDPEHNLADMNRMDNSLKSNAILDFDYLVHQPANPDQYEFYLRPDLWWNKIEGLKAGFNLNGSYMKEIHAFDLSVFYNSGVFAQNDAPLPLSWELNYKTRINKEPGKTFFKLHSINDAGWNFNSFSIEQHNHSKKLKYGISLNSSYMGDNQTIEYISTESVWDSYVRNTPYIYLKTFFEKQIPEGDLHFSLTTGIGDISNSKVNFIIHKTFQIGKLNLRNRGFIQYNLETNYPSEDALLLSGANALEQMQNRITRSHGIIPPGWRTFELSPNHFHYKGGLNLRGYSGAILALENEEGQIQYRHRGNTGISVNTELSAARMLQPVPEKLKKYLMVDYYTFFDAGLLDNANISSLPHFNNVFVDAGIGVSLNILQWWRFEKINPLSIRLDMPLFLNIKPYGDDKYFKFRWLIGIEKSI
ncbi:MAG: M1 family metallopeptidase [Bacteroidales bacterium]|nr:M1 family metallopeptidase [Bacteroidales bacterium]